MSKMRVRGDEQIDLVSRLAGRNARPVWHVASDGRLRALNAAADAMEPARVARLARAIAAEGVNGALKVEEGVEALGPDARGDHLMVFGEEVSLVERALAEARRLWRLSPRQCDVLREVIEGCGPREIGQRLRIKWDTARKHVQALLNKSGCSTRAEMLGKLLKMG
ncbi:MAG: hypothetical protein JST54_11270 [Deltaproteobacteria bacterium]|nr:hypothetical protein [Deltaproteobacteria bacterium]